MSEASGVDVDGSTGGHSDSRLSICSEDFEDIFDEYERQQHSAETTNSPSDDCPHPGYLAGMCIRCGADKPENDEEDSNLLSFGYMHQKLEFSKEEVKRLSEMRTADAESRGKLHLVLDLDHTLLHSAPLEYAQSFSVLKEWMAAEREAEEENPRWRRTLYEIPARSTMTKLRPGVFAFLQAMKELYEMHIYTMGEEMYAQEMAKLLDPEGSLFRKRVISREHSSTPMTKNLDVVIGSERSTVIVDDTWQVWTHHTDNLISVTRYCFFPSLPCEGTPRLHGWLECCADENPASCELRKVQNMLERIHASYFALPREERDVRVVMKSLFSRKRIRSG